jgi:hypothetical protein
MTLALALTFGFVPCAAAQAKDEFSLTDRAQGERYMAAMHRRFQEIAREPNRVVREEKLAELSKALKKVDGKIVTWVFQVRFSMGGSSVVLDLPRRPPYQLATSNYGDFLLPALTPELRLDRDLTRATFKKLKGGEPVKFKGLLSAELTQFGVSFKLVGRIVETPFGQPIKFEPFQAKSIWAGQCVADRRMRYWLKIVVTQRTKDTFQGTCTDLKGFRAYAVTGKLDGNKVELTIHRGREREAFPYFTTFKGTLVDGFLMKGTFKGGTCLFSLME